MKAVKSPVFFFFAGLLALYASMFAQQTQPSLAEQARAARMNKPLAKATKVYDNDALASPAVRSAPINIAGQPNTPLYESAAVKPSDAGSAADKSKDDAAKKDAGETLKKQIADQEKEVTQLKRELDVAQREWKLRQAAFYADAGNQLRDSKRWANEERRYDDEVKSKQAAIDAGQQKLSDLQEQLRKAGS